jgi:hypothetical protein
MKQMVDAYNEVGGNLISVLEVPEEEVSSYGVIAPGGWTWRRRADRSDRAGREAEGARTRPRTSSFRAAISSSPK